MSYTVKFDAAALFKDLNIQLKFAMAEALDQTARTVQGDWQESIYNQTGMYQPYKDRYALSVKYDVDKNNLTARIYSDDPMATPIETGIPARDMKRMLDTSLKTRVAKGGKHPGQRYLIIPFRHQTPGYTAHGSDMPTDVYQQAMAMSKSTVTRLSFRQNQLGVRGFTGDRTGQLLQVRSREYKWGGRLGADVPKRFRGMVRMETSSGKQNRSNYLTFRVMTENSTGWIVPAKPGRFIVKGVADRAQDMLTFNIQNAIASAAGI